MSVKLLFSRYKRLINLAFQSYRNNKPDFGKKPQEIGAILSCIFNS